MIVSSAVHPLKAYISIVKTEGEISTLTSEVQPLKANLPMFVTVVGIVISFNFVQPRKTQSLNKMVLHPIKRLKISVLFFSTAT